MRALRALLTTEGTYPFVVGGVSSWCQQLLRGTPDVQWSVLALTTPRSRGSRAAVLDRRAVPLILWGEPGPARPAVGAGDHAAPTDLPAALCNGLLGDSTDVAGLATALSWCRRHPDLVEPAFAHRTAWDAYVQQLRALLAVEDPEVRAGVLRRRLSAYRLLYWAARTAAAGVPDTDVTMVTAAGWAVLPALVEKHLNGTPMVLVEHGVYVREAYLAAIRTGGSSAERFLQTRLAVRLASAGYASADVIAPVTSAHLPWELALGAAPERIRPIPNAVDVPAEPPPPAAGRVVLSVGRIDPLKDVHTLLRVAAAVTAGDPAASFVHCGPISDGQGEYAASCERLHAELRLGSRFTFAGLSRDVRTEMRRASIVLVTSTSEALPLVLLEAMAEARPVVATSVGGVVEALGGGTYTRPPGDVSGLANTVAGLLADPSRAARVGAGNWARARALFDLTRTNREYGQLLEVVAMSRGLEALA
jgi:glycosyltransferase involved in cell wall biosynthesis